MKKSTGKQKTIVGDIHPAVLEYTAGKDVELDCALIEADCQGTAAHVTMLSRMPVKPPVISKTDQKKVLRELQVVLGRAAEGKFKISLQDQDVHLAVERALTKALGDLGKKVHTGRSRNDQVALDLRLYGREQLLQAIEETAGLAGVLIGVAKKYVAWPMAGRTHMQPAMPSSVGLWASAHAEGLLDDIALLIGAYELNDQSPLGSAAGYGVPLPIDRGLVAELLGFSKASHNVLYASNARGRIEIVILNAMSQVMLSLGRLAQDLMIYTLPEFGYFSMPAEYGTGSSIMPQKNNPDVLELVRARASRVHAQAVGVFEVVNGLPTGYNRDLQEAKEPFMEGIKTTRASIRVMTLLSEKLKPNKEALLHGFSPGVFATDKAIELVGKGMPFRDAYAYVKNHIEDLAGLDPYEAIAIKTHEGATAGLDFEAYKGRIKEAKNFVRDERSVVDRAMKKLFA